MNNQGPSRIDLPGYLAALPLFGDLGPADLNRLAEGCALRGFDRGQAVFHAGDPCDEFHIVVLGHVKLYLLSAGGQEKVIDIVGPGQSFCESLMFTGAPYNVHAQALTGALVLGVAKKAVLAEIERDPRFCLRMLGLVSHRVHGLVRDVEDYALCNGAQRVIGYLLREGGEPGCCQGLTVSLPVSKATVASRLSLTPEYFSRVLHELEDAGLVEIERREIRIPDPRRLAEWQQA